MSNNNVNDKYQKMDPVEHVLKLPDTYVGSTEKHTEMIHVLVDERKLDDEGNEVMVSKIRRKQIIPRSSLLPTPFETLNIG